VSDQTTEGPTSVAYLQPVLDRLADDAKCWGWDIDRVTTKEVVGRVLAVLDDMGVGPAVAKIRFDRLAALVLETR
jgi:hypothetical protein